MDAVMKAVMTDATLKLSDDQMVGILHSEAAEPDASFSRLFSAFAANEAKHLAEGGRVVRVGNELMIGVDALGDTFCHFVEWAESVGLLRVTEEGKPYMTADRFYALDNAA